MNYKIEILIASQVVSPNLYPKSILLHTNGALAVRCMPGLEKHMATQRHPAHCAG